MYAGTWNCGPRIRTAMLAVMIAAGSWAGGNAQSSAASSGWSLLGIRAAGERTESSRQLLLEQTLLKRTPEITVTEITYLSGGLRIQGFVLGPVTPEGTRLPVVLVCRGGNGDFGRIEPPFLRYLAALARSIPAVLVATNYRGAGESEGFDGFLGRDIEDVIVLPRVLEEIPGADPTRLGLLGYSRGGGTALLALRHLGGVRGAACVGGFYDLSPGSNPDRPDDACVRAMVRFRIEGELDATWLTKRRNDPGRYSDDRVLPAALARSGCDPSMPEVDPAVLGDLPFRLPDGQYLEEITRRSVVRQASSLRGRGRILLLHGQRDDRVQVSQAEELSRVLAESGVDHELVVVPGGNHSLTGTWGTLDADSPPPVETAPDREIREGADRRLIDFFRDVLEVTPN